MSITGLALLPKLSISLFPNKTLPSINISYSWYGANSLQIEQKVTSEIESSLSLIRGINKISSKSSNNYANITLDLDKNADIDFIRFEVATSIRNIFPTLPQVVSYPQIRLNSTDEENKRFFKSYIVKGEKSTSELFKIASEKIIPSLQSIDGIQEVELVGTQQNEYVLHYSEQRLISLGLKKNDLLNALQSRFLRKQLGAVTTGNQRVNISLLPNEKIDDWHFIVKQIGDTQIYFDQLVEIEYREKKPMFFHRINGENALTIYIHPDKNANTLNLSNIVNAKIKNIKKKLNNDIEIIKVYDATTKVKQELDTIFMRSLFTFIILLVFVILVSFNYKYVIIVFISLFANLIIAINFYYFLDIQIQLYSLAGITISLGLVIDNIVVVIDQYFSRNNGKVILAILASTTTSIGALLSIYFLDDELKLNLIDFALVIAINLITSVAIAHWLVPALIVQLGMDVKKQKTQYKITKYFYIAYYRYIEIMIDKKWIVIIFAILIFGIPTFMLPNKLEEKNELTKLYNTTIGNNFFQENIKIYINKVLGGTFRLFSNYVFESTYYNTNKKHELVINAHKGKGSTVEQMNEVAIQIENSLKEFTGIAMFESNVYSGQYASIRVKFYKDDQNSSLPYIVKSRMIMKALDLGGVRWSIYGVGDGFNNYFGSGVPVNYVVEARGYNYNELNKQCDKLKIELLKHSRINTVSIKENIGRMVIPKQGYLLEFNSEKMAMLNIDVTNLSNTLKRYTYNWWSDMYVQANGENIGLRFSSKETDNFDLWNLNNEIIRKDTLQYKIGLISSIKDYTEEENIYKENQEYIRRVEWQYAGSEKFGNKYLKKVMAIVKPKLPMGYRFQQKVNNYYFQKEKENQNYLFIILLVLIIIYFIASVTFENFWQPFVVISLIPLSFTGVFITFYFFDYNFDQGGMASFILLSGLTVNSTIFIINAFNGIKRNPTKEHTSDIVLYLVAFKGKITPILLTVISTILGFIPFVYSGQNEVFWFALGVATIGGLIMSLVMIVLVLPILIVKREPN